MKTLKEVTKQASVFLHNWDEKLDVVGDFEDIYMTGKEYRAEKTPYANEEYWREKKAKMAEAEKKYSGVNILFASYGQDNYSGDAFVLFEEDGKLFEVNGGHCSCYGLEGQWEPESTTLESLKHRLTEGTMGKDNYSDNEFNKQLSEFIGL
ncbi:MAG: hypothetical protein KAT90_10360 [Gammaproteobacteria bacterium]|nr:hypothetical protein [Gammaproteobacteria bacterium]